MAMMIGWWSTQNNPTKTNKQNKSAPHQKPNQHPTPNNSEGRIVCARLIERDRIWLLFVVDPSPAGRSLVEIQHLSGANIQISKKGIFAPGTRNRIVTITGGPNAINVAHYLIEQRIQEEEAKRACQTTPGAAGAASATGKSPVATVAAVTQ